MWGTYDVMRCVGRLWVLCEAEDGVGGGDGGLEFRRGLFLATRLAVFLC